MLIFEWEIVPVGWLMCDTPSAIIILEFCLGSTASAISINDLLVNINGLFTFDYSIYFLFYYAMQISLMNINSLSTREQKSKKFLLQKPERGEREESGRERGEKVKVKVKILCEMHQLHKESFMHKNIQIDTITRDNRKRGKSWNPRKSFSFFFLNLRVVLYYESLWIPYFPNQKVDYVCFLLFLNYYELFSAWHVLGKIYSTSFLIWSVVGVCLLWKIKKCGLQIEYFQ